MEEAFVRRAAEDWLDVEVSRVWLLAEDCLRRFQRAGLRPPPEHPALAEIEAIFAVRRAARAGEGPEIPVDEELARSLEYWGAEIAQYRAAAPIGRLIELLGLHELEVEVLAIAIAPHVDPPLGAVFSLLRGDSTRTGVDLALVAQLLRAPRRDRVALLDALAPEHPLLAWRLVQVDSPDAPEAYASVLHRSIRPTLDLLTTLCGRDEQASPARPNLECNALAGLRLDERPRTQLARLLDAAAASRGQPEESLPWLLLWGAQGTGKAEIASRWAACAGKPLLPVDVETASPAGSWQEALRRAMRDSLIHGAVLYLGPLSPDFLGDHGRKLARELARYPAMAILGVESIQAPRLRMERPLQEFELPLPSVAVQIELWEERIPAHERAETLDLTAIVRGFHLTPGEIIDIAAEARALAGLRSSRVVLAEDLRGGIKRRLRNALGDVARRLEIMASWDDLVLGIDDHSRVLEFVNRGRFADRVYSEWGFGERVGYGKGMIALFSGPPGTGKTMLAGLIANALKLDIYLVDLSQIMSRWVGETEKQLSRLFDLAQRAHAVLLFDEADALFAKRTELDSAQDRYGNLAVNHLLQQLEQYCGVAILTTNKEAALDPALQRRVNLHLRLQLPEAEERERLWRSMLPVRAPQEARIDFAELARSYELSGGYIKNAAVRAAFLAAAEGRPLTTEIMHHAAVLELEDIGRLAFNIAVPNTRWRAETTQEKKGS